jgi:energy-coupling factor transport system ATP-binding protein
VSEPVVVCEGFGWRYRGKTEQAVSEVDLTITEGTFLGVVGPNEAGKTTLLSAINGLIPHHEEGVMSGTVHVLGDSVRDVSASRLALEVGFVFSDPETQFTAMTVEDEIVFGLENMGLDIPEITARLEWASDLIGVTALLDKSPFDLSGGQKQRVAIAAVIAMRPRILVLDEPTSMLDPESKAMIFQLLGELKEALGITLVVAEHELERLVHFADELALVEGGRVTKVADPRSFFDDPAILDTGLKVPDVVELFHRLREAGLADGPVPVTLAEADEALQAVLGSGRSGGS